MKDTICAITVAMAAPDTPMPKPIGRENEPIDISCGLNMKIGSRIMLVTAPATWVMTDHLGCPTPRITPESENCMVLKVFPANM